MAPLLISVGALLLIVGGAGLFAGENVASYGRLRDRKRGTSALYVLLGAGLLAAGIVALRGG